MLPIITGSFRRLVQVLTPALLVSAVIPFAGAGIDKAFAETKTPPDGKHLTIAFTNDTLGYLESCKCSTSDTGGLPRRVTFVKQLRKEDSKAILVDSGNQTFDPLQLDVIFPVLRRLKYCAVGIGAADRRIEEPFLAKARKYGIPLVGVSANPEDGVRQSIILDVSGIKVGIVSFGVPPSQDRTADLLSLRLKALTDLRSKVEVLILLDQAGVVDEPWLNEYGPKAGYPDVVIGGQRWMPVLDPKIVGPTMIAPTGFRGTHVGIVKVELQDGKVHCRFERAVLDDEYPADKDTIRMLKDVLGTATKS